MNQLYLTDKSDKNSQTARKFYWLHL